MLTMYRLAICTTALPQPVVDVPTRWNSTYAMLQNICVYKEFTEAHLPSNLQLSDSQWADIELLLSALEPVFIATLKLQSEQLYFGDFYKLWLKTKLTIKSMNKNVHCEDLAHCLENREEILTTNEVILSAIYLDPRIRRILIKNPIQQALAKNHLSVLMRQMLNLNKQVSFMAFTAIVLGNILLD